MVVGGRRLIILRLQKFEQQCLFDVYVVKGLTFWFKIGGMIVHLPELTVCRSL